jgi:hypothetical protein
MTDDRAQDGIAELIANGEAFARMVERNPWTHRFRAAKAAYERTGDYEATVGQFVQEFKRAERAGDLKQIKIRRHGARA